MNNFWKDYKEPIYALAPMEDVTDTVFRELIASVSSPDAVHVFMTEFVNTDGLCHELGSKRVIHRLQANESELKMLKEKGIKLVAQIWGTNPDKNQEAIKKIANEMDYFDGIDINMGCPVPKIVKKGCCSGLIGSPTLAQEIIHASKEASPWPVSVKTRIGLDKVITEEWVEKVLECQPAALSIHGRTQKQMSDGLAKWDEIAKAVPIRNSLAPDCRIIGNGDVKSIQEAKEKVEEFNIDGAMIGRGIFQNPWLFNFEEPPRDPKKRLLLLWKHVSMFHETWGDKKNFNILRRFFKVYSSNFNGAVPTRIRLMESTCYEDVEQILKDIDIL